MSTDAAAETPKNYERPPRPVTTITSATKRSSAGVGLIIATLEAHHHLSSNGAEVTVVRGSTHPLEDYYSDDSADGHSAYHPSRRIRGI